MVNSQNEDSESDSEPEDLYAHHQGCNIRHARVWHRVLHSGGFWILKLSDGNRGGNINIIPATEAGVQKV